MAQIIKVPEITLQWSHWHSWQHLAIPQTRRDSVAIPSEPGVYEVKHAHEEAKLTIAKANNLRRRVRNQLIRGTGRHSSGVRIRASEDVKDLRVRWAETEIPSCVEEQLHRLIFKKHGRLPKYTKRT